MLPNSTSTHSDSFDKDRLNRTMPSIAVITGAGGGIGRAIIVELAKTHDHIALVDKDEAKLEAASDLLPRSQHRSIWICDITEPDSVLSISLKILEIGRVKTLVNNAGGTVVGSLHEMTPMSWQKEVGLNLNAAFYCFHAFAESLKTERGAIINTASVNGMACFGNPAYCAAKAGLISLTQSIAVEYGRYGVRCNAVAPGTVRTGAWESRLVEYPNILSDMEQWYPLTEAIQPVDVAKAVAFLASEDARAITGVCLPVDAGLTAGSKPIAKVATQSEYY